MTDPARQDVFDVASKFTAAEEGGYSCRRDDAGNWSQGMIGRGYLVGTNCGISAPVLIAWADLEDDPARQIAAMRALDETTFKAIARSGYWRGLGCDGLPPSVALLMFDFGFNAGVRRAGRLLQAALGMNAADIDGDVGPKTQQWARGPRWQAIAADLPHEAACALQLACHVVPDGVLGPRSLAALAARADLWPAAITRAMAERQKAAYRTFAGFDAFGAGWLARTSRRLTAALALLPPTSD